MRHLSDSLILCNQFNRHVMKLTQEQLARIEENRQRAISLRNQKNIALKSKVIEAIGLDVVLEDAGNSNSSQTNATTVETQCYGGLHVNDNANTSRDDINNYNHQVIEKSKIINDSQHLCQHTIVNDLNQHVQCTNTVIDMSLYEIFNEKVCYSCKRSSDQYDMLTKSEATKVYLLTNDSFSLLKHKEQSNPHRPGWNAMKLYLRKHVNALSLQRFGSEEALMLEKKQRDEKRYEREVTRTKDALKESTSELWTSFKDTISPASSSSAGAALSLSSATATTESVQSSSLSSVGNYHNKSHKRIVEYGDTYEYDNSSSSFSVQKSKKSIKIPSGGRKKVSLGDLVHIIRGPN